MTHLPPAGGLVPALYPLSPEDQPLLQVDTGTVDVTHIWRISDRRIVVGDDKFDQDEGEPPTRTT